MPPRDLLVESSNLVPTLERCLAQRLRRPTRIAGLDRRVSPYGSSFDLEDLDATLDDGSVLQLVFKNLSPEGMLQDARQAKPPFLFDPHREIDVYRDVLDGIDVGAPRLYGAVADQSTERYWLFLERVEGSPLSFVGDWDAWVLAAQWLGHTHTRLGLSQSAWPRRAIRYDARFYRLWPERAMRGEGPSRSAELARLIANYEPVIERLLSLEPMPIHGELYPSNVLIREDDTRVCPLDWEMAALGPALMDVAALTSGNWTVDQRRQLVLAYRDAVQETDKRVASEAQMLEEIAFCRLHLAMQWLGWSTSWKPPLDQTHDWLGEAMGAAAALGLN